MDNNTYWKHNTSGGVKFCVHFGAIVGYVISALLFLGSITTGEIVMSNLIIAALTIGLCVGIQVAKSRVCSTILSVIYLLLLIGIIAVINEGTIIDNTFDDIGTAVIIMFTIVEISFIISTIGTYIYQSRYDKDVTSVMNNNLYGQNSYNNMNNQYGQNPYNNMNNQYGQNSFNNMNNQYGQNSYNNMNNQYGQNSYNNMNNQYGQSNDYSKENSNQSFNNNDY